MDDYSPSVKKNMLMNVLLTLSSIIFPLITLPYITRVLGAEGVGRVYFASSVITFFAVFTELGIPVYGVRACARVRDSRDELSKTVQEILIINLLSCAAVYAVFFISVMIFPALSQDRFMLIVMSSGMLLNALGVEWLYKALEKYTYITVRSVVFKFIALLLMFLVIREESDYVIYGCLTIFATTASNILNFLNLRRYVDIRPAGGYRLSRHIPAMLILFVLSAAIIMYTNLDLAMLDIMKGDVEAGIYGVSVKIKLVAVSIVTSVGAVLLPRTSYYYDKGRISEAHDLLSDTMRTVLAISVPLSAFFILFAGECVQVLGGENFAASAVPMKIIMPAVIIISISSIMGMQMLVPAGREKDVAVSAVLGAAVDLILNLILIPKFASAGAAAATLAAEIMVMIYLMKCIGVSRCRTIIHGVELARIILYSTLAAAVAFVVRHFCSDGDLLTVCVSAASFFLVYGTLIVRNWKYNGLLH